MSSIKIYKLSPAGLKFFQDKENFLNELTNQDMLTVQGGDCRHTVEPPIGGQPTLVTLTFPPSCTYTVIGSLPDDQEN